MGKSYFVYAHKIYTSLLNPNNLTNALLNTRYEAVPFPDYEFITLLNKNGKSNKGPQGIRKLVLVVDADEANKWPDGTYGINKPTTWHEKKYMGEISGSEMIAINRPALIESFGCKKRVTGYLKKQKEVLEKKGRAPWIYIYNQEDFDIINEQPYARFLVLGDNLIITNDITNRNIRILGKYPKIF